MRRAEAGPGPPAIEGLVSRSDNRGVMTQPEVIVRREGNDLSSTGEGSPHARCIEVGDAPPQARFFEGERFRARTCAPAHESLTSSIASARTSTIVSTSSLVTLSGGINTITSPRGLSRTPRSTAAAQTRLPRRAPGASSTPPMRPASRMSTTVPSGATLSSSRTSSCFSALVHVSQRAPLLDQPEMPKRDRCGQSVALERVPVIQGSRA